MSEDDFLSELKAIEAAIKSPAPWSEIALSAGIRHVQRNTDVFEDALELAVETEGEGMNIPSRYDGEALAKLRNLLPKMIAYLEGGAS